MRVVSGDLLALAEAGMFDVLVHGCNCQRVMDAGIAKQIKARFPAAYEVDLRTEVGEKKLGTLSWVDIELVEHRFTIVNAYTQVHWQGSGVKVSYDALRSAMRAVRLRFSGRRIGYPKIGAGLAGGDWALIAHIIAEELEGENHTLVEYSPTGA